MRRSLVVLLACASMLCASISACGCGHHSERLSAASLSSCHPDKEMTIAQADTAAADDHHEKSQQTDTIADLSNSADQPCSCSANSPENQFLRAEAKRISAADALVNSFSIVEYDIRPDKVIKVPADPSYLIAFIHSRPMDRSVPARAPPPLEIKQKSI